MQLTIDGILCHANEGETLMEVAGRHGIRVPSLCHKDGFGGLGRCRLCLVEVDSGRGKRIVAACQHPARENDIVTVHTEELLGMRRNIVMMLAARSPENPVLQDMARAYGAVGYERFAPEDADACILCGLCVEACAHMGTHAISMAGRGIEKRVATPFEDPTLDCIGCGACAHVCPTGAIEMKETDRERTLWNRTFELVECARCGKPFATRDELDYGAAQTGDAPPELCESCRRRILSEGFMASFKDLR